MLIYIINPLTLNYAFRFITLFDAYNSYYQSIYIFNTDVFVVSVLRKVTHLFSKYTNVTAMALLSIQIQFLLIYAHFIHVTQDPPNAMFIPIIQGLFRNDRKTPTPCAHVVIRMFTTKWVNNLHTHFR